ncbi:MAG: exodeoxyribonuclease VII small subunit [Pyrinomonadaceae bacterium]|nr:exodeoxyribonuclease VII small subunit [Pyrinomonadaceae bacterium]
MAKRELDGAAKKKPSESTASEPKNQDFETSLASLEKIVRELERGDLPLEKSLELFERGVRLSRVCQERLSEAERRVEVLLRDDEGRLVIGNFEDDDEAVEFGGAGRSDTEGEPEEDEDVF